MKRALMLTLLSCAALLAQHGRGVAAGHGGGPKTQPRPRVGAPPQKPAMHNDVATHLERHPDLAGRLQPLVPAGMTVDAAAAGFKNTGQFIAALHISKNLGIPFADLKSRMTGPDAVSLGKAIQELKPGMPPDDVEREVKEASRQAKADQRSIK